jgi:hypothetical protein
MCAYADADDLRRAVRDLQCALGLAEPEHRVRALLDEGPPPRLLLRRWWHTTASGSIHGRPDVPNRAQAAAWAGQRGILR